MDNTEDIIANAPAETVVRYLAAAIKRVGELGLPAGEAFAALADENAGDVNFEEGMAQINA